MDGQKILDRKAGRELATACLELISPDVDKLSEEGMQAFWEKLRDVSLSRAPLPKQLPEVMSDKEAEKFRKQVLPFGQYKNETVEDVVTEELSYLAWMCDQKFMRDLRRFMRRQEIQVKILEE